MTTLREWLARFWATLRPRRQDADLEEELRLHMELEAEHERRNGRLPEDARRAARLRLGGASQAMDALRDQRGLPWFEDFVQDVRFGLRTIRRSPVFAAVVVLSLALGIGANSALFSLIDATLLRELSVEAPEELVQLRWQSHRWFPDMARFAGSGSISRYRRSPTFSNSVFDALRARATTLSDVFAFSRIMSVSAAIDRQAHSATVQLVSGAYFSGLRVTPSFGRPLTTADDSLASAPAVVISHRFWQRRFDRDQRAVGATVSLDGMAFTIVGVTPAGFRGVASAGAPGPDFWVPLAFGSSFGPRNLEPGFWWLSVMGRMRPEVTLEQVRDSLAGTFRAAVIATDRPPADDLPELHVWSARRGARQEGPEDELEHAVIFGAIFGGLLLVVCLNVANLLLSRSAARRTEIAVRLSLGAGRGRLIRQLLAESVTLAIAAGALGVALAYWGKELFAASTLVPAGLDLRINAIVVGVTLLISTATGILFGLAPALRATRAHPAGIVQKDGLQRTSPSRLNRALLVTQVAMSVVLLFGAGLFVRTLGNWNQIDAGFDTHNLLVFQISPSSLGYDDAETASLREQLATRIRAIPGVAGVTTSGSFWKDQWFGRFFLDGVRRRPIPHWLSVRHDFFGTLGLPVLAGRGFLPEENVKAGPPRVGVVDETFARQYLGNANPIGRRVTFDPKAPEVEIIVSSRTCGCQARSPKRSHPGSICPNTRDLPTSIQSGRRTMRRIDSYASSALKSELDPIRCLFCRRSGLPSARSSRNYRCSIPRPWCREYGKGSRPHEWPRSYGSHSEAWPSP